ncbi:hypothetical protein Z517_09380 [Fonsecaea pedrosoi CBS 271.37]|uniref:Uncharacterized protein n=1 Tax=Fonsecaea pedrosoi CBS 271.37 TaxID=1442368 RepID=A0A0D2DGY1_9EURO|nr:uncharacterized protein Z517_09380 [Fonsecaea pedrosoi CBS 271.37]KIW76936.1 hypothetical protein Z517_09380 [Fonsecaea pedrosoi CBS 271.37]
MALAAASFGVEILQLDAVNAVLASVIIDDDVTVERPPGMHQTDKIRLLRKALKWAPEGPQTGTYYMA